MGRRGAEKRDPKSSPSQSIPLNSTRLVLQTVQRPSGVQAPPPASWLPQLRGQVMVGTKVGVDVVGFGVGAGVGANVGPGVGDPVGAAVGRAVGAGVGSGVGDMVGAAVGRSVGAGVGRVVEGEAVGDAVKQRRPNSDPRVSLTRLPGQVSWH